MSTKVYLWVMFSLIFCLIGCICEIIKDYANKTKPVKEEDFW